MVSNRQAGQGGGCRERKFAGTARKRVVTSQTHFLGDKADCKPWGVDDFFASHQPYDIGLSPNAVLCDCCEAHHQQRAPFWNRGPAADMRLFARYRSDRRSTQNHAHHFSIGDGAREDGLSSEWPRYRPGSAPPAEGCIVPSALTQVGIADPHAQLI